MMKILLVDDDRDIHEIITLTLSDFEIVSAYNGADALKIYSSLKEKGNSPILVLQDLGLPDMDGIRVTQEIKKMDTRANICALSGSDIERMEKALGAGASDFLIKPFQLKELREKIDFLCHKVYA